MKLFNDQTLMLDFIVFQNCSNNCSFCFQRAARSQKFIDEDRVLLRFSRVLSFIEEKHQKFKQVYLDLMGGEMFFIPGLEKMYQKMLTSVYELSKKINKPIKCLVGTNLLYQDLSPLFNTLDFMRSLDQGLLRHVFTSFDFDGRFHTQARVDLFKKNLLELLEYMKKIPMQLGVVSVLTKRAVQKLINPQTRLEKHIKEVYDQLYQTSLGLINGRERGLRLSWTGMSPNSLDQRYVEECVPTAQDILKLYKYLREHYPTLLVVESFTSGQKTLRCCNNCYVCKDDTVQCACGAGMFSSQMMKPENLYVPSNDPEEIFKHLIKRFRCMECEFFQKCYIRPCPALLNLKAVQRSQTTPDFCWRKEMYALSNS